MDESAHREPPVWEGRPAWGSYFLLWLFVAVLAVRALFAFGMGTWGLAAINLSGIAMLSALAFFLRRTTRYRVTRRDVSRSAGFLGKGERSFPLSSIASVREEQGPLDRILGCGDLTLHLKDGTRERLAGVKDPDVVRRKIAALL